MSNRRDPLTIDAFNHNGGTCEVYIKKKRLEALAKLGRWALLNARDLVPAVLENPSVIFERFVDPRDDDEKRPGWRCYCGKPIFTYDRRGDQVASDPKQVFLVFVNDEAIAYNWRWEFADETDTEIPKDRDNRFREKVYDIREDQ